MTGRLPAFLSLLAASACGQAPLPAEFERQEERRRMVQGQLETRGIQDRAVLRAMLQVPRHRFVPEPYTDMAYQDSALPIGWQQTISQPYIVAFMSAALEVRPGQKILEIGTGSGYQAAILAELGAEVYSIEILQPLAERAAQTLEACGYSQIRLRLGDGYQGWPEEAPFDAVILTAAPDHVPEPLRDQVAEGGRLLLPLGDASQELILLTRQGDRFQEKRLAPVRFVPMTGEAQQPGERDRR